ncbi:hypothetical protein OFC47_27310, partial [Escherichia coli]|nr:hypothetical protein [Escherichia coli]
SANAGQVKARDLETLARHWGAVLSNEGMPEKLPEPEDAEVVYLGTPAGSGDAEGLDLPERDPEVSCGTDPDAGDAPEDADEPV